MSSDGFTTSELAIAAALSMTYGEESLVRIVFDEKGYAKFSFLIASCDGELITQDYFAGQLGISDLKSFWEHQTQINRRIRVMRRNNQTVYERDEFSVAPKDIPARPTEFWENARKAMVLRVAERNERERRARPQRPSRIDCGRV